MGDAQREVKYVAAEQIKKAEQDTVTVAKAALLKQLEKLLTDLNIIQEGLAVLQKTGDNLDAQITELSERFNRFVEYVEGDHQRLIPDVQII